MKGLGRSEGVLSNGWSLVVIGGYLRFARHWLVISVSRVINGHLWLFVVIGGYLRFARH
jgi:hypothetical protein